MRIALAAVAALIAAPSAAFAQDAPSVPVDADIPPGEAARAAAQGSPPQRQGVIVYQPDFFASSSPDTALDMVNRVPGFGLDLGNTATRGLAGAAGNVLIDGARPASKSDRLDEVLSRIPAASVERIELIRGGAPGIDMQGKSVLVNVVVRQTVTREVAIELNSYLYPGAEFGPQARLSYSRRQGDRQTEFALYATTDRTGGTGFGTRTRTDGAGGLIQLADLDLWDRYRDINLRGSIQRPVGRGKLRINGLFDFNTLENRQTVTVLAGAGSDEFTDSLGRDWTGELGARWEQPIGTEAEIELTALQRLGRYTYDYTLLSSGSAAYFALESDSGESAGRAIVRYRPEEDWALEGGGEIAYNFLDSVTSYRRAAIAVDLPNAAVRVSELRGEGFAQATWRITERLTLEAGTRAELSRIAQTGDTDSAETFFYLKPRVQATWAIGDGHQLRLRAERVVSQLDFDDFVASNDVDLGTVAGGNADLVPQQTTVFDAAYEYRFWQKGVVSLLAQRLIYEDIIDYIPLVDGFDAVGNIGSGTGEIVQLTLALPFDRLGLDDALLQARTSWQWSRATDPLTGEERRISGQLGFACSISFDHDIDDGRWAWGVEHGCDVARTRNYRVRELRRYIQQPMLEVYVQWKPSRTLTVRLEAGNVNDVLTRNIREVHAGRRDTTPILFVEERATRWDPWLFLKLRKTL
ncbi:TonB-dependent receptor plug domain-containing protein [Sphingosinithalassobacter sp. LHW66-3]|uniref:TonB-dependent receptor plug domain-containing protein n=1 Tax=Sphingosinithalassobacter sp. LHW66-3 TaxID=3424718 RepID=UPI003D6A4D29